MTKYNVSVIEGEETKVIRVEQIDPTIHSHHSGRPFTKDELSGFDVVSKKETTK
jgi:hypothetical protein